jgi:glycosyltransferase involved in cell wall biosynthesis
MIILSNSLCDKADEGGLKVATSIVKRIKKLKKDTLVITYERESLLSDKHLEINKLMLSRRLITLINKAREEVLYIPFPAPMFSMAVRIFVLSIFARFGLRVALVRQYPMNIFAKIFLRLSRAKIITFSESAKRFYSPIVKGRVEYVKLGVDTEKFKPATQDEIAELKKKYGFGLEKPIVLHVGHMKEGRNIRSLLKISDKYQVVLAVSSLSPERQNAELRAKLEERENIKIIDEFIENIEELFKLADVYFFPVKQLGHCIDVPLSCLEAAACNKPVITTSYGEMQKFIEKSGFYYLKDFSEYNINYIIEKALDKKDINTRQSVMEYDWANGVKALIKED